MVYSQCGLTEAAENLQLQVVDFAIKTLGMEHMASMDILLLLSRTYWQLARMEDAAEVLKRVLDACNNVRVNRCEKRTSGVQTGAMLNASLYHQIILLQHHHAGAIVSFQSTGQSSSALGVGSPDSLQERFGHLLHGA